MNNIIRNILAVIVGVFIGGIANMAIVMIGPMIIPPPAGADMTTVEGLTAAMHLLDPKHFVSPFLAHALGTLVGAVAASFIAGSKRLGMALIVGAFFLLGGIAASYLIPAPLWFKAVDILLAYIPMAWLGWKISGKK